MYVLLIILFLSAPLLPKLILRLEHISKNAQKHRERVESARKTLDVASGASADEIKAAHKRLIQKNHPDAGGSQDFASKINEARDILLKNLNNKK